MSSNSNVEDRITEDAFLRAIVASPQDNSVRLVYADWLDGRGELRGGFIRSQIALSKAKPENRLAGHALKLSASALYWRHHDFWSAQYLNEDAFLRAVAASPQDVTVRRICADWHEGGGAPQAEFIQLQMQIALATDEGQITKRQILETSASALYQRHQRFWKAQDLTEDAFLRAIAASPQDQRVRIIFADWFGDPRAEFIRLQIAIAAEARAAVLYWRNHCFWKDRLQRCWNGITFIRRRGRGSRVRGWCYRRGFPEVLDVDGELFGRHADLLLDAAPFQEIVLRCPSQRLPSLLTQYLDVLRRVETIVLPALDNPQCIPKELTDRIRVGVRAQQTIAEFRTKSANV